MRIELPSHDPTRYDAHDPAHPDPHVNMRESEEGREAPPRGSGEKLRNSTREEMPAREAPGPKQSLVEAPLSGSLVEARAELADTARQLEALQAAARAGLTSFAAHVSWIAGLQATTAPNYAAIIGGSCVGISVVALGAFLYSRLAEASRMDEDALYISMLDSNHDSGAQGRVENVRNSFDKMNAQQGKGPAPSGPRHSHDHRGVPLGQGATPVGTPRQETAATDAPKGKGAWRHEKGGETSKEHRERLKREQKLKEQNALSTVQLE